EMPGRHDRRHLCLSDPGAKVVDRADLCHAVWGTRQTARAGPDPLCPRPAVGGVAYPAKARHGFDAGTPDLRRLRLACAPVASGESAVLFWLFTRRFCSPLIGRDDRARRAADP